MIENIRDIIKPGAKIRLYYGDGNSNNQLINIRAVVDEDWIVIKKWSYTKQRWNYKVENMYWFELRLDKLTLVEGGSDV